MRIDQVWNAPAQPVSLDEERLDEMANLADTDEIFRNGTTESIGDVVIRIDNSAEQIRLVRHPLEEQ